ncbi:aldehyde dehydrogenase family protein [Yinghuangia seranimata]|uniref:aldehyde dehydrogenase family protein n=1 Tax=Yinghuangia seranimata TaxID=408067 RepID=UPI00248AE3D4|nr:aldehyde dehydrogenase family protein [Yinghuangia seranimata]MDI2132404.1 aldehyde dehydrogenase family protein [Yinghuangia seranimata]
MSRSPAKPLYVDGQWFEASGQNRIAVTNPTTEEVFAYVPRGSASDADRAVAAARAAQDAWGARPQAERVAAVESLHKALEARASQLTEAVVDDVGTPHRIADKLQTQLPLAAVRDFIGAADGIEEPVRFRNSRIHRSPVGVVAAITPWNYPLLQTIGKVVPALLSGSTVVLKPSEVAPLVPYVLAEAIHEAGLPPGVFNMVSGVGPEIGAALAGHPDVDMVSFTGSTAGGRAVAAAAARGIKRVALELGGKSAAIALPDADLERAVKATVSSCLLNSGQTCLAISRLLVPRERYAEAVELAAAIAARFTPGNPRESATKQGPLVSATQRDRVRGFIDRAVADGAAIATGGAAVPDGLDRGYFVRPTVIADADPGSEIAQEEVFGPVLVVLPYEGVDDAVRIANGTPYGLSGAVWGPDEDSAVSVARRLRSGQVDVNGGAFNSAAPFGGMKLSGTGREFGRLGLEEYYEVQSLQL